MGPKAVSIKYGDRGAARGYGSGGDRHGGKCRNVMKPVDGLFSDLMAGGGDRYGNDNRYGGNDRYGNDRYGGTFDLGSALIQLFSEGSKVVQKRPCSQPSSGGQRSCDQLISSDHSILAEA